ncbi:MAG: T9SS type A sorting domain-containing protein [Bacteroidetes bacterium]|nr:T9SS type A sorting domain-containing protein [Bacteroidota bacterium]
MTTKITYLLTQIILMCSLLKVAESSGQGFSATSSNWDVPVGGIKSGATNLGFYLPGFYTASSYSLNSQNWNIMDINGDGLSDLVVTSENLTANTATVFGAATNPYWKVYLNNGSGFSTLASNWAVPVGGLKNGANNLGFYLAGFSTAASYSLNSQNWNVMDMNGDNKPDLVVTSENLTANTSTVFSPSSNPYWKVYLNTGSGFSTIANNWAVPVGGLKNGANNVGFYLTGFYTAASYSLHSQNWNVTDINADGKPDLVVTSENLTANTSTVFGTAPNLYWKVYLNTGTGFSTTASNWAVPIGGLKNGATNLGFYLSAYSTAANYSLNSQNWNLMDINADGKPDLVVTSENLTSNTSTVYSAASNPYWKVYLNNGSGFSTVASNWTVPMGGLKNGANNLGFYLTAYYTAASYALNSQNWNLMDINGDGLSDLVVTSENLTANNATVFSPTSNPYWKVYLNNGSGFSTAPSNWAVPVGGLKNGANNLGFYLAGFSTAASYSLNSQNWNVMDMNGDNKPDLVVTSENLTANTSTVYSPTSNPYWKVYINTSITGGLSASDNFINDISIFPNPFSNQITFSFTDKDQTTITLYNFLGKQMLQQTFTNSLTINAEQLGDGIYFYAFRNSKGLLKTGKVIKQ